MVESSNRCLALITLNLHPIRITRVGVTHLWIEAIIMSSRQFEISLRVIGWVREGSSLALIKISISGFHPNLVTHTPIHFDWASFFMRSRCACRRSRCDNRLITSKGHILFQRVRLLLRIGLRSHFVRTARKQ